MAPKASALSAAIATGVSAPPIPNSSKKLLDPAAFPCLEFAEEIDAGAGVTGELVGKLDGIDLSQDMQIVGSLPTNTIMDGKALADYELNPWRRRGGEEAMPAESPLGGRPPSMSRAGSNFLSDAVIGSLPKGLTLAEKTKIQQSVPMSPAMGSLKAMKQDVVMSRTGMGKNMRRQVIKGAVMVFVTAGYSGKRFIFEKAKEMGIKSIVLDGPDSWCQILEKEGIIEKFVPIDFADAANVLEHCYEGIKAASKQVGELDGITTFCEIAVPLASRLAEKLGLPHNSVEAVDNARDKHATRDIMEKAGLPTPKHYRISVEADVAKAGAHVGFPSVIKPISGAASIGVIRVNSQEDLDKAYRRVVQDMSRARIVAGALIEGDDEGGEGQGNASDWMSVVLMLEEYLDGDEVDCDLVFDGGVPVYGAVCDNWPTIEPYFNETGSNQPSILSKAKQEALLELSVRAVQSLGFQLGVFHVECKYTTRGPRLIEVNCRMGGGPVRDMNLLTWGIDLVEEHLMACCGIPVRPCLPRRPIKQIAEFSVNAEKTGVIEHVDFLEDWKNHPDVLCAEPLVKPGQKCTCVADGLPTWVASLMVSKPTVKEAIDFVKQITGSLNIPIR